MRVIAGTAKRIQLKTAEGLETRPTTDRIKETLFNMLENAGLYNKSFLDLFSGSGGIGIEALSRGAKEVYFVEKSPRAVACIKENLEKTRLKEYGVVMKEDVFSAIKILSGRREPFDFIFMDPPYDKLLEKEVLLNLKTSDIADENTRIIVEASLKTDFSYVEDIGYSIDRVKEYKTNKHIFVSKN